MMDIFTLIQLAISAASLILLFIVLLRSRNNEGASVNDAFAKSLANIQDAVKANDTKFEIGQALIKANGENVSKLMSEQRQENERSSSSLRNEISESISKLAEANREQFKLFGGTLNDRLQNSGNAQEKLVKTLGEQQEALRKKIDEKIKELRVDLESLIQTMTKRNGERILELTEVQKQQFEAFTTTLGEGQKRHDAGQEKFTKSLVEQQEALRNKLDSKLKDLSDDNAKKLDEMRKTVDEKLQSTLEKRLGESFKQVSERLEQVHKGLGDMQTLAGNVGDLKRTLTNVKTRGTWGEAQLANLLSEILTPEQYIENAQVKKGSAERVEFAIQLPGRNDNDEAVLLSIDSKFPMESFERLSDASEVGDKTLEEKAAAELERSVVSFAKSISAKYINPPLTTDFAILYLPTEGLFAEVLRRPGLAGKLQRELRIIVTGPTTFAALLSSLQMGFRTLAVQKRSSEVWQVLAEVKTEFGRFGGILDSVRKKIDAAGKVFSEVETRTNVMNRKLRSVETLPEIGVDKELSVEDPSKDVVLEPID